MLTTNLSTRPFYNVRVVRTALTAVAVLLGALTLANSTRYLSLAATERAVGANAQEAESEAARLRSAASGIVARLDQKEIDAVASEAKTANAIIDQRAFSWTRLLEQFETALPADVRITAIQPRIESDGRFIVSVALESRRIEGVDAFVEALGARPEFRDVLSTEEQTGEDGLIAAIIEAIYTPGSHGRIGAATAAATTGTARE
jgi:Tfp pilus assembly protein PilN